MKILDNILRHDENRGIMDRQLISRSSEEVGNLFSNSQPEYH